MITFWQALIRGLQFNMEENMFKIPTHIPRIKDYSNNANRLSTKRHINNQINGKDFRANNASSPVNNAKTKEQ